MASATPDAAEVDPFFFTDRTRRTQGPAGPVPPGAERGAGPGTARPGPPGRKQWGGDRRTRAMPIVPQPVSDSRVAMARLAIIVTVTAWVAYLITWCFQDFFHPGYETAVDRAEAILYLILVTLLTASSLAFLISRLGFFYRTRTHHRTSRAIIDQFFDATTPTLTTIIPPIRRTRASSATPCCRRLSRSTPTSGWCC